MGFMIGHSKKPNSKYGSICVEVQKMTFVLFELASISTKIGFGTLGLASDVVSSPIFSIVYTIM